MSDSNYTLKNPRKYYIWSVRSMRNQTSIYHTSKLAPKDFCFQVGQFVGTEITEMKLIGYKLVKDYWGRDVEETFENTGKFMKKEIIDAWNNCDVVKRS
tara:strand:+ start:374 stop:670 length:297 start_codon:yes stop_codon:yes gene_type:complete